jgi:hypothetical protein
MQSFALLNKAGNPGSEIPIAKRSLALICVPKQELGNEMKGILAVFRRAGNARHTYPKFL